MFLYSRNIILLDSLFTNLLAESQCFYLNPNKIFLFSLLLIYNLICSCDRVLLFNLYLGFIFLVVTICDILLTVCQCIYEKEGISIGKRGQF